jgi:hypothetical protein
MVGLVMGIMVWAACGSGAKVEVHGDSGESDTWEVDGTLVDGAGDLRIRDAEVSSGPDGTVADLAGGEGRSEDGTVPGDALDGTDGMALDAVDDTTTGPTILVSTYAPTNLLPAGVELGIECLVQGLPQGSYVTYLSISGPAEPGVQGTTLTFYKVGTYRVACVAAYVGGETADETPVKVVVTPGKPAKIQTELSHTNVLAGAVVYGTCTTKDTWNNIVDIPAMLVANPSVGLDILGLQITARKVGTYQVTCYEPTSQISDLTPEVLAVGWNVPSRLVTTVGTDTITAGQSTLVTCTAYDGWDNQIPDFPMSVFLSSGLTIVGFNVGGTRAGNFQVICVPQGYAWDLFVLNPVSLRVKPAAPASVELRTVPPKPVYKLFETVDFVVSARDQYGNLCPDAQFHPMYVLPNHPSVIQKGPMKYKFEAEGVFQFHSCLVNNASICGTASVTVDGYGPVITIDFPERGATLNGKPSLEVVGSVSDQTGVARFEVNGFYVPLDAQGRFTFPVSASHGLNFVVAVAEDTTGFKTLHVQSFYYSPVWHKADINDPKGSMLRHALIFFLGRDFFDKDVHNHSKPDNLSTILEMTLRTLDIGNFIPNPVAEAGPYKVYVGPFYYNPPNVRIWPVNGGIEMYGDITQVRVRVKAIGTCKVLFIDFCPDVSGWVDVGLLFFEQGFGISLDSSGQLAVNHTKNNVVIGNVDVDIDGIIGFLFGWLVDWFVSSYKDTLQDTVMQMIGDEVVSLMSGLLDELKLEMDLPIPNPLDANAPPVNILFTTDLSLLNFSWAGVQVRLDPAALAAKNQPHDTLGSIGRADCMLWVPEVFDVDQNALAHIGLHDDLLNQVLFSVWNSGLLNMTIPVDSFLDPAMLQDFGINSLADLGISNLSARTEFYLPPIITSCTPESQLQFQVGDIYVELNMKLLNQPVTLGMFASMAAEAEINVLPGPTGALISLAVGDIDPMFAQITYVSPGLQGAQGILSMLIQGMLLPSLLGSLAQSSLAEFPLPEINLSGMSNMLPPNIIWRFDVHEFYRQLGYTAIKAGITVP